MGAVKTDLKVVGLERKTTEGDGKEPSMTISAIQDVGASRKKRRTALTLVICLCNAHRK